jgi:hypothetical protein
MNLVLAIQAGFIHSTAEMKERLITEANTVIWNKGKPKEKKHFICEPEGYNPSSQISRDHLEQLQLYKAWCAFCHKEYTKNLLCVLEEMSLKDELQKRETSEMNLKKQENCELRFIYLSEQS